jgi:zinc protease
MLDRTIAPTFVKSEEVELQEAEKLQINGIPIHILRAGIQRVIKIEFVFNAGKAFEHLDGVAYFTAKMLREGTRSYNSKSIAHKLDDFGAHLELNSTLDFSMVSLYCMSKHVEELLPMLLEIVTEPVFPEDQLDLMKEIELQQLKIDLLKTSVKARRIFRQLMYGDHPYGKSLNIEDIGPISTDKLKEHFNRCYTDCEIFISGQFDEDDLVNLLYDQLPQKKGLNLGKKQLSINYITRTIYEEVKDSLQTTLRLGFPFVGKHHKDYIPFQILNHIFGGYFGSRLMKNLREDKGFTYGIYSAVISMKDSAYFIIGTDVVQASADQAIEEILKEMKELKEEEVPMDELETVKNHITGSFQSDITSPFALMDKYKTVYMYNMDYSYYQRYFEMLDQITPADIKNLAEKYFTEDKLSIVKVG